jgi:hypothetical protein
MNMREFMFINEPKNDENVKQLIWTAVYNVPN